MHAPSAWLLNGSTQEEADPEYFFVPYVWEIVYSSTRSDILWCPEDIVVFEPLPPVLETREASAGHHHRQGTTDSLEREGRGGGRRESGPEAAGAPPPLILTMNV